MSAPSLVNARTAAVTATADVDADDRVGRVWVVLNTVLDPEVPALSVCDLGIVREVRFDASGENDAASGSSAADMHGLEIVLTPTYSGCPATEVIEHDVLAALAAAKLGPARVTLRRAPAWTTDWISAEGRRKLLAYGIAPPGPVLHGGTVPIRFAKRQAQAESQAQAAPLACPQCGSRNTERLSAFGATACKALYRCVACREPFEHFKPI